MKNKSKVPLYMLNFTAVRTYLGSTEYCSGPGAWIFVKIVLILRCTLVRINDIGMWQ